MSSLAHVAWAFLRRDVLMVRPWKWLVEWLQSGLWVSFWYFMTRIFKTVQPFHSGFQVDYFTFSLIGLALSQYVWRGFVAFADRVKAEQTSGALEPLWATAYPLPLLVILSSLWDFLTATVNAGIILLMGTYLFGAQLNLDGILTVVGVGLVTSLAMGSLGLLASSWTIACGRGEVFRSFLNNSIPLLSGAFFPVSVFPGWLQAVAWCLPLTHALNLARGILLPAGGVSVLTYEWIALMGITALLLAAGWMSFFLAVHQARLNGRIAAA